MRSIGTPRQIKVKRDKSSQTSELAQAPVGLGEEQDESTVRAFLNKHRAYLRIDDPATELLLDRKERDDLNRRHLRFRQHYDGLPVWPAEMIVHVDAAGRVDLVDGAFVPTPRKLVTKPVVTAQDAVQGARSSVPGSADARASEPELIIYGALDKPARLAWKVVLEVSMRSRWIVVVDALNRQILSSFDESPRENVNGAGVDLLGKGRPVSVWHEDNLFYLVDTSKPMYITTSNPPDPSSTKGAIVVLDAGNQPSTSSPDTIPPLLLATSARSGSGWLPDGISAAYNLSTVYDYYRARHNRNSINGDGGTISAVVRFGLDFDNAFWSSELNSMFFGDGKPYAGALDVVAHEMTHGVTSYSANLLYQNQSGALNEAFSDIFGQNVEAYATGSADWLHGDSLGTPDRNLKDPSSISIALGDGTSMEYPSKMSEFVKGSVLNNFQNQDNGGVHINSSIVNHAYYLLAAGLNGALGMLDAERIFYRALTTHLTRQSEFIDARLAAVQSAQELFGEGSAQAVKTGEAFDAVEIYDATPTPIPDPIPAAGGVDSALFIGYDPQYGYAGDYRLARRESSLGDGFYGTWLSSSNVKASRPSVTADGTMAAYVTGDNDVCFMRTDDEFSESCAGIAGLVHSVAMARDGEHFAFVLLDDYGYPENRITVLNLATDEEPRSYSLVAPTSSGLSIDSIDHADAMVYTSDNRFLMYDALNIMKLADGATVAAWSLYAIDLITGETLVVVPPIQDYDIGFPSLGHTSDNFLTFDAYNQSTAISTVYAANLHTGALAAVGTVNYDFGVPSYNGDDTAIIYSVPDESQWTEHSFYRQPLGGDHISPSGTSALWLSDGDYSAIYRRGAYHQLTVGNNDASSGTVTSNVGGISCGDSCSYIYPSGTAVTLTAKAYAGSAFAGWGGACSGTGICNVTVSGDRSVTATFSTVYALSGSVRSGSTSGPAIPGATVSIGGKSATTGANGAFTIGGISSGTYTLTVSAAGYATYTNYAYAVTSSKSGLTFSLTPNLPNLIPYAPAGWSDKIIVSTTPGSTTDSALIYSTDTLYLNRAVLNESNSAISASYDITLYVDGKEAHTWTRSSLAAGYYTYLTTDYSLGSLSAGVHTLKLVADPGNSITESNESDNSYTKTITVLSPSCTMSGTVRSGSASGPAIRGATVSFAGKTATTDANGAFSIGGIAAGTYTLTISAAGYTTYANYSRVISASESGLVFPLASPNVQVQGSLRQYALLKSAYDDAPDGAVLLTQAIPFAENLSLQAPKKVTVKGGYDTGFLHQSAFTTLRGVLRVGSGRLTANRLVVR